MPRPPSAPCSGIPAVRKKITELEGTLLTLQQDAGVPRVTLQLHPTIQALVSEARSLIGPAALTVRERHLPNWSDFRPRVLMWKV